MKQVNWVEITRWSARVVSLLILVLLIVLVITEGLPSITSLTTIEILLFAGFFIMAAGLVWAWWQPMAGGAVTMLGFIFFSAINLVSSGSLPGGWVYPLLPLTGSLHIVYGFQLYCRRQASQS
jgi:Na+/alanine symporter